MLNFIIQPASVRYNTSTIARWEEFNTMDNKNLVTAIHKDLQSKGFSLGQLQKLFREVDSDFIITHRRILFDL
jgi:hypothetical protein